MLLSLKRNWGAIPVMLAAGDVGGLCISVLFERGAVLYWLTMLRHFKADLFKALAHPIRIMILDTLRDGEAPVRVLQERLGIEQSSISQHLAALRANNLVRTRRDGSSVFYEVADAAIWEMLDIARDIYERQLHTNREMFEALR